MEEIKEKKCNRCNLVKPLDEYYNNKKNKLHGKQAMCKECNNVYTSEYQKRNKRERFNINGPKNKLKNTKTKKGFYLDPDKVWEAIYNETPIDNLYPDIWNNSVDISEDWFVEGEEYLRLEGNLSDYIVTNYGRAISLIGTKAKFLTPTIHSTTVVFNLQGKRVNMLDILEEQGWSQTPETLEYIYNEHKWKYYRYQYEKSGAKCIIHNK